MNKLIAYFNIARAFVWGAGQKRKYLVCGLLGVILTLLAQYAVATEITPLPSPKPTPTTVATATAGANAESSSSANSSSGGNSLSVTEARRAPSLAQGSLYLAGCGFSANAGGSDSGGAAFFGIQFITAYCRDQAQIQREAQYGNIRTACEMDRLTPSGKRNLKRLNDAGIEPEPCPTAIAQPAPPPEPKPTVVVLTGESCTSNSERVDRVLEKCVSK